MSRGKYESPSRRGFPATWIILIVAVLGLSFGAVRAYLFASSDPVTNAFTTDVDPVIAFNPGTYEVTVTDADYQVFIRAAVVVNWKSSAGNLLATQPQGYTLTPGTDWFLHSDGFYYYKQPIGKGESTTAVIQSFVAPDADSPDNQPGYTLSADVSVQAIQAVGMTDGATPEDAVKVAWGITAAEIKTH